MNWWLTIIASLLSGLIGSFITMIIDNKKEAEREKAAYKKYIFQTMLGFRGDVTERGISTGKFTIAANQVFVAFNDNISVIRTIK